MALSPLRQLAALCAALALTGPARAEPKELKITTKLGVQKTVQLAGAQTLPTEHEARQFHLPMLDEYKLKAPHLLVLDLGHGARAVVPLNLVRHVKTRDKAQVVTLSDRTELTGILRSAVTDRDKKVHDLGSAEEITVVGADEQPPAVAKGDTWALKVDGAGKFACELIGPKFVAVTAGRWTILDAFSIVVENEPVQGNLSEMKKLHYGQKKDKSGHRLVTVQAPKGNEITGRLGTVNRMDAYGLCGKTPAGWVVVVTWHHGECPGLTLERTGPAGKEKAAK